MGTLASFVMTVPSPFLTGCFGYLAWALSICAQEQIISAPVVVEEEPTYFLRPDWKDGECYHWTQRFEAVATVAGLGKQTLEWRQHFHLIPAGDLGWEICSDQVRLDLKVGGDRSRYYFDPIIPLRFQDRQGIQGTLLQHTEQLVRHRYQLTRTKDGRHRVRLLKKDTGKVKQIPTKTETALARLPLDKLTQTLLHQGFPPEPVPTGSKWNIVDTMLIPTHGQASWDMTGNFSGFKVHNGKRLALVKLKGHLEMTLHEDETVADSPGLAIKLSKIRGLTLLDLEQRQIVSSVVRLDGTLHSLGLPGTAEGETAPFKSTLTLSSGKAPKKVP